MIRRFVPNDPHTFGILASVDCIFPTNLRYRQGTRINFQIGYFFDYSTIIGPIYATPYINLDHQVKGILALRHP